MNTKLTQYLYFGNLPVDEPQYRDSKFLGLALNPEHNREIRHDIRKTLPFEMESIIKIQSQDVFEHISPLELVPILNDIFRVLMKGGVFRLSVPDYKSPYYLERCVFDERGVILADLRMGGSVGYDRKAKRRVIEFLPNGNSHVWFPTYNKILDLISNSDINKCQKIVFYHHFFEDGSYINNTYPDDEMPVKRAPPHDLRAGGRPLSIIVDFIK